MRNGHYFNEGFYLFIWIYYFSGSQIKMLSENSSVNSGNFVTVSFGETTGITVTNEDLLQSYQKFTFVSIASANANVIDASAFSGNAILAGEEGDDTFYAGPGTVAYAGGGGYDNSVESSEIGSAVGAVACEVFYVIETEAL